MALKDIRNDRTLAHVVPLVAFLLLGGIPQWITGMFGSYFRAHTFLPWWRSAPEHWILPLQAVGAFALLVFWWRHYEFHISLKATVIGIFMGIVGIGLWLLPTHLYEALGYSQENEAPSWLAKLGVQERRDGFDARIFGMDREGFDHPGDYLALTLRFFRAVVVVALVEEIFWRAFLMRYLLKPDGNYWKVPFGQAHWKSYLIVTAAFMVAHAPVDYVGALAYGSLMYITAIWSRSLWACVLNHAVANAIMGAYALQSGKYGLW